MSFTDTSGDPIGPSPGAAPFSAASLYGSDDLFGIVWNYLVGALATWIAAGFVDFTPVELYIGHTGPTALLPPDQDVYLRLHFHGSQVDLDVGTHDPAPTYVTLGSWSFTSSPVLNAWANLEQLLTLVFNVLDAAYIGGVNVFVAGVALVNPKGDEMAVGDTVKLVVKMTQFGSEPLQLSHHFKAHLVGATFDSLEAAYRTAALGPLAAAMHTSVSIDAVVIEDRINVAAPTVQRKTRTYNGAGNYPVVGTQAGGGANGAEPGQLAACISWETPFAGRGERGRSYLPGLWDAASENGVITPAYSVLAQAYADALVNNFGVGLDNLPLNGANDWYLVLWREHVSNPALPAGNNNPPNAVARTVLNPEGYAFPPVTKPPFNPRAAANGIQAAIVRPNVRTQRRRGRGVRIGRRRSVATVVA